MPRIVPAGKTWAHQVLPHDTLRAIEVLHLQCGIAATCPSHTLPQALPLPHLHFGARFSVCGWLWKKKQPFPISTTCHTRKCSRPRGLREELSGPCRQSDATPRTEPFKKKMRSLLVFFGEDLQRSRLQKFLRSTMA